MITRMISNLEEKQKLAADLRHFYQTSEPYAKHLEAETEAYFTRYLGLIEEYGRGSLTILDAGCGTGLSSYMLSLRKHRVIGLDLSEFFLRRGSYLGRSPNLSLVAGDMLHLPFSDQSIDFVGSYLVISFVPDISRALEEITRVLKPGGKVLIVTPNQFSPIWPLRDFFRMLAGGPPRPVFCESPAGALKTCWDNLKSSLVKLCRRDGDFWYRKPDLSSSKVVGRESDAVYRPSPLDFERFFKNKGFRVFRTGSRRSWVERLFPFWAASVEFAARKS